MKTPGRPLPRHQYPLENAANVTTLPGDCECSLRPIARQILQSESGFDRVTYSVHGVEFFFYPLVT